MQKPAGTDLVGVQLGSSMEVRIQETRNLNDSLGREPFKM
jgi:hypothetical protein